MDTGDGEYRGVAAVIDQDYACSLLAREVKAELVRELSRNRHSSLPALVGVDAAAMTAEAWPR